MRSRSRARRQSAVSSRQSSVSVWAASRSGARHSCARACGRRGAAAWRAFRRSSAIRPTLRSSRGAARFTTPNAGAATVPIFAAASAADRICCARSSMLNDRDGELIEPVLQRLAQRTHVAGRSQRGRCEGGRGLHSQHPRARAGTGRAAARTARRVEGARRRCRRRREIFRCEVRELSLGHRRSQGHRRARSWRRRSSRISGLQVDGRRRPWRARCRARRPRPAPMTTRREATVVVTLPNGDKVRGPARAHRRFHGVADAGRRHAAVVPAERRGAES